jgi:DNA-binding NarL/FixJ family response regulator
MTQVDLQQNSFGEISLTESKGSIISPSEKVVESGQVTAVAEDKAITILIVEDDKLCRVGLKLSLQRFDHLAVVAEAANGQEALDQTAKFLPQVILLDIGLPVMNGIDVCRKIKAERPETVILMLSSHTDDRIVKDSLNAGADGYFNKDVDIEVLAQHITDGAAKAGSQSNLK